MKGNTAFTALVALLLLPTGLQGGTTPTLTYKIDGSPSVTAVAGPSVHDIVCFVEQGRCKTVDKCSDDSHRYHEKELNQEAPYNVMALAGAVGVGALLRWASKEIRVLSHVPYTIMVFLVGLVFGFLTTIGDSSSNPLSLGDDLAHLDPHLIFFIFLPILIFESAFSIDGFVFRKVIGHCLILAGPGLLFASFLTAAMAKGMYSEYEWSWVACFLFGTILSATDPVAVVALLKELGAGAEVSALIEGESLFNDGTAIVVFTVLKSSVPVGTLEKTGGEILWQFIKISLGGPAIGLIAAFLSELILTRVFNDPLIEVSLTVAVAYITFFLAEGWLHVSGVLALVILGLYLSMHRQCFSPEVEHMLHGFWGILVFITNTLIFALAGLIVAKRAFKDIQLQDYGYLVFLYLALNIVRGLTMLICTPAMMCLKSYSLDLKNSLLVGWGGLRGAVGLALALIVENDTDIHCTYPMIGPRFIFFVSGIVILTLVINGMTTQYLVSRLGLNKKEELRQRALNDGIKQLKEVQESATQELAELSVMANANWNMVRKLSRICAIGKDANDDDLLAEDDMLVPLEVHNAGVYYEAQEMYYKYFINELWHQNHSGTLSAPACRWLLEVTMREKERGRNGGGLALIHADVLAPLYTLTWVEESQLVPLLCSSLKESRKNTLETARWTRAFEITIAFIQAHETVMRRIKDTRLNKTAINIIRDHCKLARSEGLTLLDSYQKQRPNVAVAIKTKHAARLVLNKGRSAVNRLISNGLLEPSDGELLISAVETKMEKLRRLSVPTMEPQTLRDVMGFIKWASIDHDAAYRLSRALHREHVGKGEVIVPARSTDLVIIVSGVGRQTVKGATIYYGPAYACGLLAALTGDPSKATEMVADTDCTVEAIHSSDLLPIISEHKEARREIWREAAMDATFKVLYHFGPFERWNKTELRQQIRLGHVLNMAEAKEVALPRGYYWILVKGSCVWSSMGSTFTCEAVSLIPKSSELIRFKKPSVVFIVKDPLSEQDRARKNWQRIGAKIEFIHKLIAFLCTSEMVSKYRKDVTTCIISEHFSKGRNLFDILGGGIPGRRAWRSSVLCDDISVSGKGSPSLCPARLDSGYGESEIDQGSPIAASRSRFGGYRAISPFQDSSISQPLLSRRSVTPPSVYAGESAYSPPKNITQAPPSKTSPISLGPSPTFPVGSPSSGLELVAQALMALAKDEGERATKDDITREALRKQLAEATAAREAAEHQLQLERQRREIESVPLGTSSPSGRQSSSPRSDHHNGSPRGNGSSTGHATPRYARVKETNGSQGNVGELIGWWQSQQGDTSEPVLQQTVPTEGIEIGGIEPDDDSDSANELGYEDNNGILPASDSPSSPQPSSSASSPHSSQQPALQRRTPSSSHHGPPQHATPPVSRPSEDSPHRTNGRDHTAHQPEGRTSYHANPLEPQPHSPQRLTPSPSPTSSNHRASSPSASHASPLRPPQHFLDRLFDAPPGSILQLPMHEDN
eukprot:Sspe_Gene.99001::Locus_72415_Transcript_1_1_Confidence_1.000_Length_4617::g.99001::m.99001